MVQQQKLEAYLNQFTGSEGSYPFGPEALVFKVKGKMFALVAEHQGVIKVTYKCQPADGEVLVSQFEGIIPGYHMNKRHWITVSLSSDVNEAMLLDLADKSYQLVVSKLRKVEREELALL
ncbi:MmcQ/YjbR family DNA-binding protein [Photobacterium sp. SDRW27]|uniref:MmcQ/YjbR family DNA-binding protein n=1 Tax=Photobacterium obscurum TaxID=2829490 RepID=UPI002243A43B|nr:MmcQ/YjbR family DNA-binding protein [Photobacterium obscurum]MCW8327960.1 MmcQ/YjbR family DNA-binding protein [Photobacterium obscurum]